MTEPHEAQAAEAVAAPTFDSIPLSADMRKAVDAIGYKQPTPVQIAVFEPAVRGKNLVVQARTGTGKTAAFGLPVLDQMIRRSTPKVQVLALTPTRELALQVTRELERLAQFRGTKIVAIYGGASAADQITALKAGAQIVVGTPGRVLDHIRRGTLETAAIRVFVLDEADEMLSMGFAKELNAICESLPKDRQGLFFSATIPPDIERLAIAHLKDPEFIVLSSDQVGALDIAHSVYILGSSSGDKRQHLIRVLDVEDPESAIIFCNTKDETERLAEALQNRGYDADWLNGDLDQKERERVMSKTREGKLRFLVATDVAARGIDISHLSHVINFDFPEAAEVYVHRTGRTGRAGKTGTAISLVGPKEIGRLYLLRLTYKIRPIEKQLPTVGELKTRAEQDVVQIFEDAYGARDVHPDDMAIARRLLTHDDAEKILACLVRDHLGARPGDPKAEAAEARRAKNPPPAPKAVAAAAENVVASATGATSGASATSGVNAERKNVPAPARVRDEKRRPEAASAGTTNTMRPSSGAARTMPPPRANSARTAPTPRMPRPVRNGNTLGSVPIEDDFEFGSSLPKFTVSDPADAPRNETRNETRNDTRHAPEAPLTDDPNFAQIFVNIGRRDGARAEDLQKLLEAPNALLPDEIGAIRMRDRNAFVSVKKDAKERAVAALAGQVIKGRTVNAELARAASDSRERPRER